MLSKEYLIYYCSLDIVKNINKKNNSFINWKKIFTIFIYLIKKKIFVNLFFLNKNSFLKEIIYILRKYVKINIFILNFIKKIYRNKYLFFNIKKIYSNFLKLYLENKKIIICILYYYKNINNINIFLIKNIIKKFFFKKRIFIIKKKKKSIILGFKVCIYNNNFIIDYSIKNNIKKLIYKMKF